MFWDESARIVGYRDLLCRALVLECTLKKREAVLSRCRNSRSQSGIAFQRQSPTAVCDFTLGRRARLTYYVEVRDLVGHRVRVYLAHVKPAVGWPHVPYVQPPHSVVRVRHFHPVVLRHHQRLNGQYGLRVHSQPRDLHRTRIVIRIYLDDVNDGVFRKVSGSSGACTQTGLLKKIP